MNAPFLLILLAFLNSAVVELVAAQETYPETRYTAWDDLDPSTQDAAMTLLGYTAETWDLPGTNEVELLSYSSLDSSTQLVGATEIGITDEDTWDCYISHYNDYDWAELLGDGINGYARLGWTEASWEGVDVPPETESLAWEQLSPEQQEAADDLCFFNYTWDGNLTIPEWEGAAETTTTTAAPTPGSMTRAPTSSTTTTDAPAQSPVSPTLPPTEAPATPSPTIDIAMLPSVADFRYVPWSDVDSNSIESLGYNQSTWELPGTAAIEAAAFSTLVSTTQRREAVELGFTEATWNCYQNHFLAFGWSELEQAGAQRSYEALGWTESSWNEVSDPPASEDKDWSELTDDENAAAAALCFREETWNGEVPIPQWGNNTASADDSSAATAAVGQRSLQVALLLVAGYVL